MTYPELPAAPEICDNVACPCSSCDNAGENQPKNPILCDNCEKLKEWEAKECSSKSST